MTSKRDNRISNYQGNVITLLEEIERREAEVSGHRAEIAGLRQELKRAQSAKTIQPVTPQKRQTGAKARGRAAVVCWDLGHNPAGRAVVIYDLLARDWDVDLVGPLWDRYGGEVWPPIARSERSILAFKTSHFEDFYPKALGFAAGQIYDLVVVVKPRLPGLLLGAMIQKASHCPLVLDIDDFELSFFKDETPAPLDDLINAGAEGLDIPFEELPTRACESVIGDFPAKIVSNVALRGRYGGVIVRHARDETVFHPARFDREAARRDLGITDDDFAIVFVGTPRPHKGIYDVAKALHEMKDKRFVFHIVGTVKEKAVRDRLASYDKARIVYHPNCEMHELPQKLAAADALALLQDPDHPISQYQIPAKVSDGAAFGYPILATQVPPLRDLFPLGILRETKGGTKLKKDLAALMQARASGETVQQQQATRAAFLAELGNEVNALRLSFAVAEAEDHPELPESMERLLVHAQTTYSLLRLKAHAPASPAIVHEHAPDIVAFWKQNDSKLFGRRSDMLMKYLQASGAVGRILQFDAPQPVQMMHRLITGQARKLRSVDYLVQQNMIDDQFGLRDSDTHLFRTFLYADKTVQTGALPDIGRAQGDVVDYVRRHMHEFGFDPLNTIAWVCPVVFDFPEIAQAIPFKKKVADLIDDQRTFPMKDSYRQRIVKSYEDCLPLFDTVLTNCAPMAASFSGLRNDIHVVPNGSEVVHDIAAMPPMDAIVAYGKPIIGYVGNLRDRFDWPLLAATAKLLPEATFVIVGGGARDEDTDIVKGLPNVVLHGPVPYDQVQPCIRAFDVAIMPHEKSDQTSRMNPLKIYNYVAMHRPIVTTHVSNIDEGLMPYLRFADGPEAFAAAIEAALREPLTDRPGFAEAVASISWEERAAAVAARLQ